MSWLPWSIIGVGGTFWAFKEGKLNNVIKTWSNYNENAFSRPLQQNNQPQPQPQYQPPQSIILQAPQSGQWGVTSLIVSTAVFTLAGYYYYIHHHGTKKVITKVEETSEKTQDMVKESDLNNEQRFAILEQKNEERNDTLQTEIRSEVRTGFDVVQNQLYLLTQVAVKTLTTLAKGMGAAGDDDQQEHLLNYSNKAQETMDNVISSDYKNEIKQRNISDVRADIAEQKKMLIKSRNKRNNNNNNNNNNDDYDINEQLDPITFENSSYNKFMTSKTFPNTPGDDKELKKDGGKEEGGEEIKNKNKNKNKNKINLWRKYTIIRPSYSLKLISGSYYEYVKPLGFIGDQIIEHKEKTTAIITGIILLYIINNIYYRNNIKYKQQQQRR